MSRGFIVGLMARAILPITFTFTYSQAACADTFEAKVVSVSDGDTVTVLHNGAKEKVILFGADCPEMAQEFGPEARQFTDNCCYQKIVKVDDRGRDDHGRTIAVITLGDGTNLNRELVARGLAWWSDKYAPNESDLKKLFLAAKSEHRGLWLSPNPIPPWIFRNGQRSTQAVVVPK